MSAGDVVCTGWLIKSPPEKKLKRYAWRRRWFVLRRGRMSGNPDVLEYYRSKSSKKPIRIIDLRECEVQTHTELQLIRRDFQNQHLFLVKTSSRIFYLVAKTEDEMKSWVHNIGQICHFELMNDSPDSLDSTQQTSPARSSDTPLSTNADLTSNVDATNGSCSDSEFSSPLDYLFLSQCETGRISMTRCNSCSNSDRSIECSSSDNTFEDMFASPLCIHPFSPCQRTSTPLSASSSILSRNPHHLSEVFKFDTVSSAQTLNGLTDSFSPPPRPPKPSHFAECNLDSTCHMPVTRRISFVGLDHARTGVFDGNLVKSLNKRLSINLPHQVTVHSPSWTDCNEDSYIPMDSRVSSPVSTFNSDSDGCIPRSPTFVNCLMSCDEAENPPPIVPLRGLPYNLDPPPVNRDLKPRRKLRPPPLDLRGLSTISENTSHLLLTRTRTEPSNFLHCLPLKKEPVMSGPLANGDNSYFLAGLNHPWPGRIRLDYLSLDFNSASPSPVQMKPLFTDEDRVDYVQVDEKKTQALQNTKIEWKDVRQSKV